MPRIVSNWDVRDPDDRAALLAPYQGLLSERADSDGRYALDVGPFAVYQRTVTIEADVAHEEIAYQIAVPYFGFLFRPVVARHFRQPPRRRQRHPWWAPPARLDARASRVLGVLAALSLIVGYVNTLLTQTITFAADEFGASERAQGVAGTLVRAGILLTMGVAAMTDRRGRRFVILATATAAPAIASLGALAPSLPWLTVTQLVGRPLALVLLVTIAVAVVEEMPKGARAYAFSLMAMSTGLGAGLCVMALPLAHFGERGWRLVYVLALGFLALVAHAARRLPETARFSAQAALPPRDERWRDHLSRFALIAVTGLLLNTLVAPASFFQNRFLSHERGFSPADITLFTLATATPAGLGVLIGGKLADRRGRRPVALVALTANTLGTAAFYFAEGWGMWAWALLASIVGGALAPSLGVYFGAELFPTRVRGRISNAINVLSLTGSSIGLLIVGWWVSAGHSYATVMALLCVGPAIVALLVLFVYPETAGRELEELNPTDAATPSRR